MIKSPFKKNGHIASELLPDLTPLLDVMFMLILFLILTANAVSYVIKVDVPTDNNAVSQAAKTDNVIAITLLPDDKGWLIDNQNFTTQQAFETKLLTINHDNTKMVTILGDKTVSMQKLIDTMTFLQKNNIKMVDIVVKK